MRKGPLDAMLIHILLRGSFWLLAIIYWTVAMHHTCRPLFFSKAHSCNVFIQTNQNNFTHMFVESTLTRTCKLQNAHLLVSRRSKWRILNPALSAPTSVTVGCPRVKRIIRLSVNCQQSCKERNLYLVMDS